MAGATAIGGPMIRKALNLVQSDAALKDGFSSPPRDHELASEVRRLSRQIHFITLTAEAFLDILQFKLGVSEEELDEAVKKESTSRKELHRGAAAPDCHACGRAVGVEKTSCPYCGETITHPDPFAEFL